MLRKLFFLWICGIAVLSLAGCSSGGNDTSTGENPLMEGYKNSPLVSLPQSIFPELGNPKAKIRIDIFFDPWCPPCRSLDGVVQKLMEQKKYQQKAVFYFHLFPLTGHFPQDEEASLLHLEMIKQNLFLEFRQAVVNKGISTYADMLSLAEKMANQTFSLKALRKRNGKILKEQEAQAENLKLNHTPTIFVNGREVNAVPNLEEFSQGIDQLEKQLP